MAFNKNPPWQRNAGMQAIVSFPQTAQPVFSQNIGLQHQQNLSLIPQMGLQQQHLYPQTVQYPASRPINAIAFQNQTQAQPSGSLSQNASKFNPNQRVFSGTGHVTKVQNDFGFIDEEVFFHKNVCKGSFPKVGDRVLVEAAYNQNMPFKWNATRVQVLQSAVSGSANSNTSSRHISNYSSCHTSGSERSARNRYSPSRRSPDRNNHRTTSHDSRQRDTDDDDRRRRREDRDNERYRDKYRERTLERERKDRDKSPIRKLSPKRRKTRPIPRYIVQMPKHLLTLGKADILELRRRYQTLYIPSDFFNSEIRWIEAFPPNEPFSLRIPCSFHVMHKDVEPLHPCDAELEPTDSDYLYSAKVMLMSTPPMDDFFQKCFTSAEERDRYDDDRDHVHPTRLINFLVGIRGKNESMAIGGPWSPSLDGDNPHINPNVLIKTAIRTCKGLTGIDLSGCTRWYRFVELYYRRSETYHKGRLIPARIETVVIFLPDVWSCQPSHQEWDELQVSYKSHLERVVHIQNSDNPVAADFPPACEELATTSTSESDKIVFADTQSTLASASKNDTAFVADRSQEAVETTTMSSEAHQLPVDVAVDTEKDDVDDAREDKSHPTKLLLLDVKGLKVAELKLELQARCLPVDGTKQVLIKRLSEALQHEKHSSQEEIIDEPVSNSEAMHSKSGDKGIEEDFETMDNVDMSDVTVIDEYDSTKPEEKSGEDTEVAADPTAKRESAKLSGKEKQLLEKRYSLPEKPHIIVHPSRNAKSGKFDCAVMSLSVLLDYRPEDSKEHSFEVSFFAELFNEMLTRDFGFYIYRALYLMPSKTDDTAKKETSTITNENPKENENDNKNENEDEKAIDGEKLCEEDTKAKYNKDKDRIRERDRDSRKRSRFDDSEEDRHRREKEKDEDRVKFYTADRDLLLSFSYFDVSHCGYIFDKDIEDLLYTLGLNLSRSQIRKLVSKALTRDLLHYRKLTDKVLENLESVGDGRGKGKKEIIPSAIDQSNEASLESRRDALNRNAAEVEPDDIAIGNTNYLDQMKNSLDIVLKSQDPQQPPSNKIQKIDSDVPRTQCGLVFHEGGVVNIPKLLEQMKRYEKTQGDTEQTLLDLRRQNVELLRNNTLANEKIKVQSTDIKYTTRKLIEVEQNLREITKKSNEYFSALSNIYDRAGVIINRSELKRSSAKRESSRDCSSRKEINTKAVDAERTEQSVSESPTPDEKKLNNDSNQTTAFNNHPKTNNQDQIAAGSSDCNESVLIDSTATAMKTATEEK